MAVAVAGLVIGTIGMISGFLGSKKASKAAKESSKEEARIMKETTAERMRQLGVEERTMFGETLAGYAGGGVQAVSPSLSGARPQTGSPATVLAEQKKEFKYERDITASVGASNVQQALSRGKSTADAYKWQGYSNAASSLSSMLTSYAAVTKGK